MADLKKLAMGRKGMQKAVKPDPQNEQPAKSLEQSSAEEVGELESAFRSRMAKEDKRRKNATDSETWFCVYFDSREAKERFLQKYGLNRIGDKYVSGRTVDRILQRGTTATDGHVERR